METDRHGMTMKGLRKAAGATKGLTGYYSGHYVQISFDRGVGEVLISEHCSFGQNSWTQYHDPEVITVCNASAPMTMQEIADRIAETVRM